jgi:hypothetical protein
METLYCCTGVSAFSKPTPKKTHREIWLRIYPLFELIYSSNNMRKAKNQHLNIVCQKLIGS